MHSVDKILRAGQRMLKNELGVFLNGTCQVGWRCRRAAVGVATKAKSTAPIPRGRDGRYRVSGNRKAPARRRCNASYKFGCDETGDAEAKRRRMLRSGEFWHY
jgi:hypothetical protein